MNILESSISSVPVVPSVYLTSTSSFLETCFQMLICVTALLPFFTWNPNCFHAAYVWIGSGSSICFFSSCPYAFTVITVIMFPVPFNFPCSIRLSDSFKMICAFVIVLSSLPWSAAFFVVPLS